MDHNMNYIVGIAVSGALKRKVGHISFAMARSMYFMSTK